jgi:hypothetical protein
MISGCTAPMIVPQSEEVTLFRRIRALVRSTFIQRTLAGIGAAWKIVFSKNVSPSLSHHFCRFSDSLKYPEMRKRCGG